MKRVAIVLVAVTLAFLGQPAPVWAECISVRWSLADQLARHSLVFIGDVIDIQNVLRPESYRERVRFQVVEAFKGVEVGQVIVDFRPTAESFRFKVGQRALVYATGLSENYSTQCTPTREAAVDDTEVTGLRALAQPK